MRQKPDIHSSQWFQIGTRFANGQSRICDFPPTPNFYLGVVQELMKNPKNKLWSNTDHPFWAKLRELFESGTIAPEMLGLQTGAGVSGEEEPAVYRPRSFDDESMGIKVDASCRDLTEEIAEPLTEICRSDNRPTPVTPALFTY